MGGPGGGAVGVAGLGGGSTSLVFSILMELTQVITSTKPSKQINMTEGQKEKVESSLKFPWLKPT